MIYTIVFSEQAIKTFNTIKDQLQNRWGSKVVIDFEQRTLKVLALIENSPLIFQAIPTNPNVRKGFIHKNCAMFYELKKHQIDILYFWDNRQEQLL